MESSGNILAVDVGGSHIKCIILNNAGEAQTDYRRKPTPMEATPGAVIETLLELTAGLNEFERISIGFPGYVRNGIVFTAPNLGTAHWENVDLGQQVANRLRKPVRLVNDADQLGLGIVSGKGLELAVTLGTGVGTAVMIDGLLLPHLELSHHPISKGRDYDQYVGSRALQDAGKEKWNKRVGKVLRVIKTVFNYDRLYLGGGSCKSLTIDLDANIILFNNQEGIKGGAKLWGMPDGYHITTNYPQ
ncbi:MAG TPA: ROK family protein [Puia sp.]|nr:ROK family protein [Puia sp.]